MIEVKDIEISFHNKKVISNINCEIEEGDKIAIIGPSGEGKSVFLKALIGLIAPSKGQIKIDEIDINNNDEKSINKIRNKIGVLFQDGALFDFLNVEDNISFPLVIHENLSPQEIKIKVDESLDIVGLRGINSKMPDELSGGMKKRVALARAIIRKPKYMFYDEPTSGLDPITSNVINDLISYLNENLNITSISITHDISSLHKIATKVFLIYNGTIVYNGSFKEYEKIENIYLKQFISGSVAGPISNCR